MLSKLFKYCFLPLLIMVVAITLADTFLLFRMEALLIGLGVISLSIYVLLFVTRHLSYVFIIWILTIPFFSQNQENVKTALDLGVGNISIDRLLFCLLITFFFAQVALMQRRVLSPGRIEMTMFIFCSVALISLATHNMLQRNYIGEVATKFLLPVLAYFLAKNLFTAEHDVGVLVWALFGFGIYLAVTGFFEFFNINSLIFPRYINDPRIGGHFGRARGPFLQAATNGTAMGMLLLTGIYLYEGMSSWSKRLLIMILAGTIAVGVLFSLTRGAWIGTAVGLLLVFIFQRAIRRAVILTIVIAAVSLLLKSGKTSEFERIVSNRAESSGTMSDRFITWQVGVAMFLDHPVFGVGFRRYAELYRLYASDAELLTASHRGIHGKPAAHNTYIEIAAELGLIGLVLYLSTLLWLLTSSIKLYRTLPPIAAPARSFIVLYWGAASVYLLSSSFYTQSSDFLPILLFTFGGILGRSSALGAMPQRVSARELDESCPRGYMRGERSISTVF